MSLLSFEASFIGKNYNFDFNFEKVSVCAAVKFFNINTTICLLVKATIFVFYSVSPQLGLLPVIVEF